MKLVNQFNRVIRTILFVSIIQFSAFAQTGEITYDNFPQKWQLYPRDSTNSASVLVSGKTSYSNYKNISLLLTREDGVGGLLSYQKSPLTFTSGWANFSFKNTIKSGLFNYNFKVYLINGSDSLLISQAEKVTCGDVMIFYGQSNAIAFADIDNYRIPNEFCRMIYISDFVAQPYFWYYMESGTAVSIGSFAAETARQLTQKYQVPICVVNGGVGSTSLYQLSDRNAGNPYDPNTYYGHLLIRSKLAGAINKAKILVWRQGETEATEPSGALASLYPARFDSLYRYFKTDFPALKKIYSFQNNIYGGTNPLAGQLRDFQRRESIIYPLIQSVATVGTVTFDGLHYQTPGYVQTATETARLISRDFYGDTTRMNYDSPAIQKAIINNQKNVITLIFDTYQSLVQPPADSVIGNPAYPIKVWRLKDYIYLDGQSGKIDSIIVSGNRATLVLKDTSNAKTISYLPGTFSDYDVTHTYEGLHFKNKLGMRALTFDSFPINSLLTLNNVKTVLFENNFVKISWDKINATNPTVYIERATNSTTNFTVIATLQNNDTVYYDKSVVPLTTYYYRIRASTATSVSEYSSVMEIKTPVLITANEAMFENTSPLVYPNPSNQNKIYIQNSANFKTLLIRSINGQLIKEINGTISEVSLDNLGAGLYLIELLDEKNNKFTKKLIIE